MKQNLSHSIINVGSGEEISIKKLAKLIAKIIGFDGKIYFDNKFPDGVMRKCLDSTLLMNMGWKNKIDLNTGIQRLYDWYTNNKKKLRT